jgi:hypothetical protein
MDSLELSAKILREDSAPALTELMQIMADPTAKARERLKAARQFKRCLHSLKRVIEAQHTAPALRRDLIEVLRTYRNGIASAYSNRSILTQFPPSPVRMRKLELLSEAEQGMVENVSGSTAAEIVG